MSGERHFHEGTAGPDGGEIPTNSRIRARDCNPFRPGRRPRLSPGEGSGRRAGAERTQSRRPAKPTRGADRSRFPGAKPKSASRSPPCASPCGPVGRCRAQAEQSQFPATERSQFTGAERSQYPASGPSLCIFVRDGGGLAGLGPPITNLSKNTLYHRESEPIRLRTPRGSRCPHSPRGVRRPGLRGAPRRHADRNPGHRARSSRPGRSSRRRGPGRPRRARRPAPA